MKVWNKVLKATQFVAGCAGASGGGASGLHGYEGTVQTDMVPQVAEPKKGLSKREIALGTTAAIGLVGTAWAVNKERKRRAAPAPVPAPVPAPAVAEATDSSDKS